jgi:hypothetical protein
MKSLLVACVLPAVLLVSACSGTSNPVSPTPANNSNLAAVSGTWAGTMTDTTGTAADTWTVSQSGTTVTGTMSMSDNTRNMMGAGTMSGTVNGKSVSFHMEVKAGGFSGMMSTCGMMIDGQGMMSEDGHTMTGSYTGAFSGMMSSGMMGMMQPCGGTMGNGTFSLTR